MKQISKEAQAEIDKLMEELMEAINNPKPSSEWTEEEKKINLAYTIVADSLEKGKYRFAEVIEYAKVHLANNLADSLMELKKAYVGTSVNMSDDIFIKMDDLKTVKAFKLDTTNE